MNRPVATDERVPLERMIPLVGDAAAAVITAAGGWGADLIVLGSRGRTGVSRLLLGSVARNVLHGSRASVLVVHERGR